jgi:hypothetical protein
MGCVRANLPVMREKGQEEALPKNNMPTTNETRLIFTIHPKQPNSHKLNTLHKIGNIRKTHLTFTQIPRATSTPNMESFST